MNKGKQCRLTCPLNSACQLPLMPSADAAVASRNNLHIGRNKLTKKFRVLVIDFVDSILAESAMFLLCQIIYHRLKGDVFNFNIRVAFGF